MTQTIRQTLDPGTGADDLLPNYTPDADPADCRADNLLDSYEKVPFAILLPSSDLSLFDLFLPKVVDHTYSRGEREEITTTVDIGIANECLAECTRLGSQCLAVTLQVQNTGKPFIFLRTRLQFSLLPQNERGGRQRCFSHTSSAGADGTDPSSSTGVTYYEKICQSILIVACVS